MPEGLIDKSRRQANRLRTLAEINQIKQEQISASETPVKRTVAPSELEAMERSKLESEARPIIERKLKNAHQSRRRRENVGQFYANQPDTDDFEAEITDLPPDPAVNVSKNQPPELITGDANADTDQRQLEESGNG